MRWLAALVLTASVASAQPPFGATVTLPDEQRMGGSLAGFEAALVLRGFNQNPMQISGRCYSACVINVEYGCVMPDAVLGLHGPQDNGRYLAPDHPRFDAVTWQFASHLPPDLGRYYMNVARYSREIIQVGYAQAIAMGVASCVPV